LMALYVSFPHTGPASWKSGHGRKDPHSDHQRRLRLTSSESAHSTTQNGWLIGAPTILPPYGFPDENLKDNDTAANAPFTRLLLQHMLQCSAGYLSRTRKPARVGF
jgi:hypothetical protein